MLEISILTVEFASPMYGSKDYKVTNGRNVYLVLIPR